ncbi:MAG TPA: PilC/PilY family type IV pilus protein, partial [Burkholderiaceae bacterium]|nr:PilC/PilY family type IV pilus protein [Burkholderiaceae bacterium]
MNRTIESGSRLGDRMPWRRSRFARALVFLLSQAIVLQPATVMAAASDWDVAQQPLFTVNPVHPNVVFMIDDSWSMNDYRLPPPQFLLENGRWPAAATVQVKYGVGLRTVAAQDEFTLRSYIHNPLAYDPAVTYLPWNDNDKLPAAQGTRPRRDENFPPADIGGTGVTATAGRFTERDMRHVGFANGNSNAIRKWITQARGSVGGVGSWFATSPASDRWGWSAATGRWEQPVADPKGTAIYPPLPGDGVQAADLFTNPPAVCKELAPCIETVDQVTQKCVQYENQKTGTKKTCVKYDTVPVFGNVCTETKDVFKGKVDDLTKCIDWKKESAGFVNGACIKEKDQPKTKTVCTIVQKPDPTSETGYRDYNECEEVPDGTVKVCTDWEKIEIFKDVCKKYAQKDVYEKQCTKWENQQTGTSQVCSQTIDEDVFTQVCVKNEDVITKVCTKRDPDWICPPASTVSDVMTPARYYRYEGNIPASDDDLAKTENYRLVEIDRARTVDYPVPLDPRTGDLRRRKDCKTYAPANEQEIGSTTCTRVEEMQNYANWFTYYRHRLFAAIAVTSQAAADLKGDLSAIRLGYGRINYSDGAADPWDPYGARLDAKKFPEVDKDPGPKDPHPGAVVRGVRSFTDSAKNDDRQEFFDFLFLLNWVGSTPNREAIDSIGTYYLRSGEFGPWADNPGKGGGKQGDQHASCRRSFAVLATDGEWTAIPEVKDVPPAQPLIEKRPNDPVNVGKGKNIAALATTGPQIQGAGLYANETYTYDPGKELQFSNDNFGVTNTLTDVALYWWNRDLRPGVPNAVQKRPNRGKEDSFWQNVTTYVVGYGLNASMNTQQVRQDIKDGKAINWPLVDTNPLLTTGGNRINDTFRAAMSTRGDFYSATDPDAMRNSIKGVFRAIAEQAYSGTGLASTSAQLTAGSTLYRASFTTQKWTGRLEAFDALDLANAAANQQPEPAPLWTASFPAWDQRQIYTSTANVAGGLAFDNFANLTAAQQAELGSEDVMDYVRGRQDGLELSKPIGFPLKTNGWRDRETLLGTIVSSTPLYSKAPNFAYQMKPAAGGGATYAQYVADNKAGRRAAVYVGANAGMFHAFDGNPDKAQGGGKELFAYVPRSAYRYMKELTEGDYTHRYFVDGPVVEGDVYLGGSWKTVVMGSGGAGEPGLFMLDVTKPEQFGANKVMWDITAMDEPDMGRVRGAGYIGSVKYNAGGKWVALVPNGYESASNRAVLLVIDVETGQTLKKFDTCKKFDGSDIGAVAQGGRCDGSKANRNGLGSVSVVFDANRNVVAAYSGDYQGNLWKFDFSSSDPSKWKIATLDPDDGSNNTPAPLFVAKNSANVRQPISAAPRATVHPLGGFHVIFGTGKFFEYDDQTNLDIQSIYGLWDKPGNTSPIDKASTYGLELSQATDANNIVQRTLGGLANFSWQTHKGWYFDLVAKNEPATGERVV